jgi:hypothetical protein
MCILNNDLKLIDRINKYIKDDTKLNVLFNHHNQKYTVKKLLKYIIIILKTGISFRNLSNYTSIHWNTIYKFYQKLCKYDILSKVYKIIITDYLTLTVNECKNKKLPYLLYTDTTLISNKLGSELIAYNPQLKKHKSTKISVVVDMFRNPISIKLSASNFYDSKIFNGHLSELKKDHPILFNSNNILLGDAAYDSIPLKNVVKELNFGELITPINIRNTKDINKIQNKKLSFVDKLFFNDRPKVENIICLLKKYKRLNIRYDQKIISYKGFLLLALSHILNKKM